MRCANCGTGPQIVRLWSLLNPSPRPTVCCEITHIEGVPSLMSASMPTAVQ